MLPFSGYATLAPLHIQHARVAMTRQPLTLTRTYWLDPENSTAATVQLELSLCWAGQREARAVLCRTLGGRSGALPPVETLPPDDELKLGDTGIAWSWDEPAGRRQFDIVGFARHNVAVVLQRRDGIDILAAAREIDARLASLRTCDRYALAPDGVFTDIRPVDGGPLRAAAGSRVDLSETPDGDTYFFLTTAGSVNRDRRNPHKRYFRAPLVPGRVTIDSFRVGGGLLPARESLIVEVA